MIESTEKLTMRYGAIRALDGVHFRIGRAEIVGLLGPNGAGKTTALKIITSYLYPSAGTVYVDGRDVRCDYLATRRMIGYLPEHLPLYMDMEVREYLKFAGNARGLYGRRLKARIEWVREKCGLGPVYYKVIRELSKGYRQRTALAQSLIHDPNIVILDEPTSGLDPHQILEIRNLIHELNSEQKTILFSTHILQEVEAIARRIIILNHGKIIADGTIPELRSRVVKRKCYELIFPLDAARRDVEQSIKTTEGVARIQDVREAGGEVTFVVEGREGDLREPLMRVIAEKGWKILELKQRPITLEEVFLSLTEPEGEAR